MVWFWFHEPKTEITEHYGFGFWDDRFPPLLEYFYFLNNYILNPNR